MKAFVETLAIAIMLFGWPGEAKADNRAECRTWCAANAQCDYCSGLRSCDGATGRLLKAFRGRGKNHFACAKDPVVAHKKAACNTWCEAHKEQCARCGTMPGCGVGYAVLKVWRGPGRNVYACTKTAKTQRTQARFAECKAWCEKTTACAKCSTHLGCGRGYKRIKTFRGPGKNVYGCKKR